MLHLSEELGALTRDRLVRERTVVLSSDQGLIKEERIDLISSWLNLSVNNQWYLRRLDSSCLLFHY